MIAAPPPPAAAFQPIQTYFKDWLLVCDNGRRCVAKAVPAQDDGLAAIGMVVERDPGPTGTLSLTLSKEDGLDPKETVLDDTPLHPAYRKGRDGSLSLSGDPALAFLRRVRGGRLLRGAHTDDGPWVRLSGLSAALLAMDDVQGRVGTVTAVVKPGPKPASAVPSAPPLPVIKAAAPSPPVANGKAMAAAVRRSQSAALKRADCERGGNTPDDEVEPLSPTEAVVILGCGMGAYQGWSLAFRVPRDAPGRAGPLRLPPAPSIGERRIDDDGLTFTEPTYDAKTATFSTAAKGRGLADCGFSTSWVFDGRDFHLAEHAEQTRCGGGGPGEWPTVYRSRVVR